MQTAPRQWARTELLQRLLEAHERSSSFGKPGPWPRDAILRIDRREFPEAFAPDGRELLEALVEVAGELVREGVARTVWVGGGPDARLKEVRLGPREVEAAYQAAAATGFEPLARAFERLGATCRELLAEERVAPWMRDFLERIGEAAGGHSTGPLGMARPTLKRALPELAVALRGAALISLGWNGWERVVSERIFRDSKRLGTVRARAADLLVRADPIWDGVSPDDADQVMEAYGVRRKPGLIRCAGAGTFRVGARSYALEDFAPAAHLPEAWAEAWAEGIGPGVRLVTTIENEYPFLSYVDERGGAAGLALDGELVVYTAGYATPGLLYALGRLAAVAPGARWRHWGDADVGGIRIWWLLRSRLSRPVDWFRTTPAWVGVESEQGQELSEGERSALVRLDQVLATSGVSAAPDVRTALEVIAALRRTGRKVEQERF
jgi:Wadjet anti plasmid transformation system JetA-like protein